MHTGGRWTTRTDERASMSRGRVTGGGRWILALIGSCALWLAILPGVVAQESGGGIMAGIDTWHDRVSQRVVDFSRGVDETLDPSADYSDEYYDSVLRLRLQGTIGEDDIAGRVSVNGNLALPGLEERLRIVFNSVDPDDPSGFRPGLLTDRGSESQRIGLEFLRTIREFDTDVSLRVRSGSPIDLLKRLRVRRPFDFESLKVRPGFSLFHADSVGAGFGPELHLRYPLESGLTLASDSRFTYYERDELLRFDQTLRLYQPLSDRRGLVYEAGLQSESEPSHRLQSYYLQTAFRSLVLRDWLVAEVRPQVVRSRDNDFDNDYRLYLGLDVLFGHPGAY